MAEGTEEPTQPGGTPAEGGGGAKRRRRRRRRQPSSSLGAAATSKASTAATPATAATKRSAAGEHRRATVTRGRHIPTTKEISAGGVVYRRDGASIDVVLASRRTRRGDLAWGLAKGGIEPGETKEQAAVREVREETGLTAEIEADLGDTKYIYVWEDVRIRKTVHFFLMRCTGGDVADRDDEMEEIRWFPLDRAIKRAAYRGERDVLLRAAEVLR